MRKYLFFIPIVFISVLACSKGEEVSEVTEEILYPEYYVPSGQVTEIELANGMIVYMDEDSTYFCGDILFSKEQIDMFNLETKSAVVKSTSLYWPTNTINYYIKSDFTNSEKATIRSGLSMLEAASELQFVESSSIPSVGLIFNLNTVANSSPIGMQSNGNNIKLARNGFSKGTVAHEVMHSLGYFHEHTRTDRDSYITINTSNIQSEYSHNFQKYSSNPTGYQNGYNRGSYDYSSIMHYGSYAFAIDSSLPVITKKDGSIINAQRSYLTSGDIAGLNFIYGPKAVLSTNVISYDDQGDEYSRDETTTYENIIRFYDTNGNAVSLTYPRLVTLYYNVDTILPSDNSYHTETRYIIIPAGTSSYELQNTRRVFQDDMGELRYREDQYFTLIK